VAGSLTVFNPDFVVGDAMRVSDTTQVSN